MRWFPRFAVGTVLYHLAVVAWGGYVRATGSGAGCGSHWPDCRGEIVPRSPTVETAIEYTHRATSGIALVLVGVLIAGAFRLYPKGHAIRRAAVFSGVFLVTEALVGALLVLAGWVAHDRSLARGVVVPIHLVNTHLLLAALALCARAAVDDGTRRRTPSALNLSVLAALLLLGMTGAVAALGDTLFPSATLAEGLRSDLDPAAHLFVRVRAVHPALALATAALVGTAATAAWTACTTRLRAFSAVLGTLLLLQLGAGLLNLLLLAPVWMQLVHLVLADLLWIAAVLLAVEPRPAAVVRAAAA